MLKHQKILLFDFETTGLYGHSDQIIEIGAILLEKVGGSYVVKEELSTLVLADKPLPPKIVEITHITDEMLLRHGIPQEEAFHRLFQLYGDSKTLLVAYNIQFDLSFLIAYFKRFWDRNFELKNDILDVMAIYKDRHRFPHRLDNVVQTYQIETPNTHRALDDIKATYEALIRMQNEQDNIEKYVNVIGYNGTYGVSGVRLPYVRYIAQKGGYREIEKS
jgi:DNA polymerase III epsilon subunit family exonuclease